MELVQKGTWLAQKDWGGGSVSKMNNTMNLSVISVDGLKDE